MSARPHVVDAGIDTDLFAPPTNACIRFYQCGNVVPHAGKMCGECLTSLRAHDRRQDDGVSKD